MRANSKRTAHSRLRLHPETLRVLTLSAEQLARVVGGEPNSVAVASCSKQGGTGC